MSNNLSFQVIILGKLFLPPLKRIIKNIKLNLYKILKLQFVVWKPIYLEIIYLLEPKMEIC